MHPLLEKLSHGDKRMVKGVDEAVELVKNDTTIFSVLIEGITCDNELVSMRSADAIEKLTIAKPELLLPFKKLLLNLVKTTKQQEIRWHLCQIIPRLSLSMKERENLIKIFKTYLSDKSRIVVTFTMQVLVDLAGQDKKLKSEISPIIKHLADKGSPAMRSRGRELLKQLLFNGLIP